MGGKKKKIKSAASKSESGTSAAMLTGGHVAESTGISTDPSGPADPYQTFARNAANSHKKTVIAPSSRWIPGQPLPEPPPQPPPPPPVPHGLTPSSLSVNPIPTRPWSPKAYAAVSAKLTPIPKHTVHFGGLPDQPQTKVLPSFHGIKSLLIDCEKGKKHHDSDEHPKSKQ